MSSFPCLVRLVSGSGQVRSRLGERLVDRYLEFVAGRCRPDTLRAVAFDLKAFFAVIGRDRVEVTAGDVFEFLADQRGDRTVIRLADRESGLSARTIARRLPSVSGLYAYLVARGDTPVVVNPVPRGLMTRRQGGSVRSRTAPLVRVPRTLPRILSPAEADRLVAALRTHRDRAMLLGEAGMALEAVQSQAGHRSIESTRVYLHLANDWLAEQYLRASQLIDADTAAVGQMLAIQEAALS